MRSGVMRGLVAVVLLAAAFLWGFLSSERGWPPHDAVTALYDKAREVKRSMTAGDSGKPQGRWRRVAPVEGAEGPLTDEQQEHVDQLSTLGYASGVKQAEGEGGVSVFDPDRACDGLNLVVSGHAPEAFLMDMQGRVLHRWGHDFRAAFPDADLPANLETIQFWRRARLLDDGRLLAIFEGNGLIEVDPDSNLLWAFPGGAHHDLDLDAHGRIWVLTREVKFLPRVNRENPVLEDFVTVLAPDGTMERKISVLEAFERSPYAPLLDACPPAGDLFHTNSVEILDGSQADRLPAFRRGNLLISLHTINVVAVLDPDDETIVWALAGMWRKQHDPTLLADGNVLVFDNQGLGKYSRVLEVDPLTQEMVWSFDGNAGNGFSTELCGASQRLPDGNTLITESESGRAFEVTPDRTVVWRYDSPYRAGKHGELVATLLDVVRLAPVPPLEWLRGE